MDQRLINDAIRDELVRAVQSQRKKRSFNLFGRGHEARVTLDRRLAAVLRTCDIPRITISGFGANHHYPARVFAQAKQSLLDRLGWSPFETSSDGSLYMVDTPKLVVDGND